MLHAEENIILVIGAGGFLGSHVVAQLLERKYQVRGTIHRRKSKDDSLDGNQLLSLPNAHSNLELIEIDLMDNVDNESWSKAFQGQVSVVIHTAGPNTPFSRSDYPNEEIIQPHITGMKNICHMCEKSQTVKRFIFTSCICALADIFEKGKEYSESDWNTSSSLVNNPYEYAKTNAERYMFDYFSTVSSEASPISTVISAKQALGNEEDWESTSAESKSQRNDTSKSIQCISLLPGLLLGPSITNAPTSNSVVTPSETPVQWKEMKSEGVHLSSSQRFFLSYLNGNIRAIANLFSNISDVRDVASAHIIAMESPNIHVNGRYIITNSPAISHLDMLQIIHDNFHDKVSVPTRRIGEVGARLALSLDQTGRGDYLRRNIGRQMLFSNVRSKGVGMIVRPPSQTIVDTCRFLLDNNLIDQVSSTSCTIL